MATTAEPKRAVLVDPYPLWLDAVEQTLAKDSVETVGKAGSFAEASRLVEALQPDLVVVEGALREGDTDGLAWSARIRERFRELKVIILSASNDAAKIRVALEGGAAAYVVKDAPPDDLRAAVRQVYERSLFLPSGEEGSNGLTLEQGELSDEGGLSLREVGVLRLMADGLTNRQIADELSITDQTVKHHLSSIYRKLGVSNRTGAARWAALHGLLPRALGKRAVEETPDVREETP